MSRCIYYKQNSSQLHFTKPEHVFPAGIGGNASLQVGVVSDEANELFSPMELRFMRSSVVSMPRQFIGPGKRGSLSPRKASQSRVRVMYMVERGYRPQLAYVVKGQPRAIIQAQIDQSTDFHIEMDATESEGYWEKATAFIERIKAWDGKAELQIDDGMHGTVLLGYHRGKWYLAGSDANARTKALEFAELARKGKPFQKDVAAIRSHLLTSFQFESDTNEFFRVCAKVAFNCLCHLRGVEFALADRFDRIRDWIVSGGENLFCQAVSYSKSALPGYFDGAFPPFSHKVLFFCLEHNLLAAVSFYGGYSTTIVNLGPYQEAEFFDGFICDWLHSMEMTLAEYLMSLNREG